MLILIVVIAFFSLFPQHLLAQKAKAEVPVTFDGQVRIRSEADGRDFDTDTDINTFTLLRARFGAHVQPLENVEVYFQVQDSRAFGNEPGTLANTANLELHQGYFEIQNLWNHPIALRAGRQELVYGNERMIGAVGFSNVGRSFDGFKLSFGRKNRLDLFYTIINESTQPVAGPATPTTVAGRDDHDNRFFGAYYQYRQKPQYKLDVYGLYELDLRQTVPGEDDLRRATLGAYSKGKLSTIFDFESELALQFGKRRGQDVLAFMLTGSVGYTFQTGRKPAVRLGYDFLSGMDAGDTDYKAFATPFPTNHKFYGLMDYFINIPLNTGGQGLQDFMVKAKIPVADKWILNAHYHNFRAARGPEKDFGNELDLILKYKYNRVAGLEFVLAFFAPGDLMERKFGNNDVGLWSYVTLVTSF